jgi:FtsH-binding integral membrane protein
MIASAATGLSVSKLKTSSVPWFGIAGLAFVLGVFVLAGAGQEVALLVALFVFLGACLRGLVLAVRDDDVSSASIRDPAARTMAAIGADSAAARRGRRDARARRRASSH